MEPTIVAWGSQTPRTSARVEDIDHFSARGMKRLYGREDWFPRCAHLVMDIWQARDGRVLVRCSSRGEEIDTASFEIIGARIPPGTKMGAGDEWIPAAARKAYDDWVMEQL